MTTSPNSLLQTIQTELDKLPPPVGTNFQKACRELSGRITEEKLHEWANVGVTVSRRTVRSWEAAAELFRTSPQVQRHLPSGQFINWAKIGDSLCSDSPKLAVAYFSASYEAINRLRPRYINDWAQSCRNIYRGTWKSSELACKVFESTPQILEHVSFEEFRRFAQFLHELSKRSYDMAGETLAKSLDLFPVLGKDAGAFISLANTVAENSWRYTLPLFDAAQNTLIDLPPNHRVPLLSLISRLASNQDIDPAKTMRDGARALNQVDMDVRDTLTELSHQIAVADPKSAAAFLNAVPQVLERVTFPQMIEWHRQGMTIIDNPEAGAVYFKNESTQSHQVLDALSSSVELERVRDVIRMYCRMLAGQDIEVQAAQQLVDKNIGWFQGELPTTEGTTIYLPKVINRYNQKEQNFEFFKVISTHQTGHIEFGSFQFRFERPSNLFQDIRSALRDEVRHRSDPLSLAVLEGLKQFDAILSEQQPASDTDSQTTGENGSPPQPSDQAAATPMTQFFDMFPDRKLGEDVFKIIETTRIDAGVMRAYRGLVPIYEAVQKDALSSRPATTDLPAREALVEFMIQISLGQESDLMVPKQHRDDAKKLRRWIKTMRHTDAIVEDSAEASIRAYALLVEIKNENLDEQEFENLDDDEEEQQESDQGDEEEEDLQGIIEMFVKSMVPGDAVGDDENAANEDQDTESPDDQEYSSPQDVDYRGEFKPELSQLLSQAQMMDGAEFADEDGEMAPLTQEQLEQMMKNSSEFELKEGGQGDGEQIPPELSQMMENLLKEMQRRDPEAHPQPSGPMQHFDEEGGPLSTNAQNQFVYDEWDFRANEYKPRWCMVHEKEMSDGDPNFYRETLIERSSLLHTIKKQFELVMPEMYRKQKRLEDGEELDIDSTLEALIDIRAGSTPDEKLYWRRNKTERSVAVAFLLDMSASTAEAIEEAKRPNDDWGAPDDPVEYMVWLRSRRSEGLRKAYKRIVDVEKEGVVLLVNALETLGDDYGIYGFSGYGRENVEFYIIKDIDEKFTPDIPRRIDRIAPLHATRMGPSIRHATKKLADQDSRSRFLFLISDGRPQDRGYSREGVEKEYAVHDTRMALQEAKSQGIVPFCLTVDKQGHDYLRFMMDDFNYEVLHDITLLPQRLLMLYKRLTT